MFHFLMEKNNVLVSIQPVHQMLFPDLNFYQNTHLIEMLYTDQNHLITIIAQFLSNNKKTYIDI